MSKRGSKVGLSFGTFVIGLFLVAASLNSRGHPYLWQFSTVTAIGAVGSVHSLLTSKGTEDNK